MLHPINPVLPGCHPDPSVCRVGEDYWLVVSSFTYWPALPVFHSHDLVSWEPAGHVIDRAEQLSLTGLETSDGVWAPTIRHHGGLFYVVSTVANGRTGESNFVVTATDPRGPWSQPVDLGVAGIDPSLFFDVDGRCWFTLCRDSESPEATGPGEIWMREFNPETLSLVGPEYVLWHGAVAGAWVEAPHLFLRDGVYYLVGAEGGTERRHSVTAARSPSVTGPWKTDPRSPLLTHRHLSPDHAIQNIGHADLVDTPDGETWALVLGVRPVNGVHALGRETFLVPVEWCEAGPVFAPETGQVRTRERIPEGSQAPERSAAVELVERVRFEAPRLPPGWSSLRGDVTPLLYSASHPRGDRPTPHDDRLRLALTEETLSGRGMPAFIARRQQHLQAIVTADLEFSPATMNEEAGLALFHAEHRWAAITVTLDDRGRRVAAGTAELGEGVRRGEEALLPPGPVRLAIAADGDGYQFSLAGDTAGRSPIPLAWYARREFSTEVAGGFVGVHIGVYATSTGEPSTNSVAITGFEYRGSASSGSNLDTHLVSA